MSNTPRYKRNATAYDKYVKALKEETEKSSSFGKDDQRFWKPTLDKTGSAYAVIRFLPPPPADGEDGLPWVKIFSHAFQGPSGKWYIENSLKTPRPGFPQGEENDPVGDLNHTLWNSVTDDKAPERAQARKQKRKLTFISNILVIDDPKNPENNGKVFLYKYGQKIKSKIDDRMHPKIEGRKGLNIFDPFDGANFELIVKTVKSGSSSFPNYDDSSFMAPSPIADTEKEFDKIWQQEFSLAEFLEAKNFKSFAELKKRLDEVLAGGPAPRARTVTDDDEEEETVPWKVDASSESSDNEDEEDDELAKFRKIAANLE